MRDLFLSAPSLRHLSLVGETTRLGLFRDRKLKKNLFTPYFEIPNNIHTISLIRIGFSINEVTLPLC